jgi:hypothetical protein
LLLKPLKLADRIVQVLLFLFHFMQSVDVMISSFFKTFDYVDKSIEYSYISKSNLEGNREEVVFLVFEYC